MIAVSALMISCDKDSSPRSDSSNVNTYCDDENSYNGPNRDYYSDCDVSESERGHASWSAADSRIGSLINQDYYQNFLRDIGVCFSTGLGGDCTRIDEYFTIELNTEGVFNATPAVLKIDFKDNLKNSINRPLVICGKFRPDGPEGILALRYQDINNQQGGRNSYNYPQECYQNFGYGQNQNINKFVIEVRQNKLSRDGVVTLDLYYHNRKFHAVTVKIN